MRITYALCLAVAAVSGFSASATEYVRLDLSTEDAYYNAASWYYNGSRFGESGEALDPALDYIVEEHPGYLEGTETIGVRLFRGLTVSIK